MGCLSILIVCSENPLHKIAGTHDIDKFGGELSYEIRCNAAMFDIEEIGGILLCINFSASGKAPLLAHAQKHAYHSMFITQESRPEFLKPPCVGNPSRIVRAACPPQEKQLQSWYDPFGEQFLWAPPLQETLDKCHSMVNIADLKSFFFFFFGFNFRN